MKEEWKPVSGWPGYEVSNLGQVRSYKRKAKGLWADWEIADTPQRILQPSLASGYRAVNLSHDGNKKRLRVAYLVLDAFVGPRPEGMEVCHNDCVKTNDRLDNLRYDTRSGNLRDGIGEQARNRLTNKQAVEAKLMAESGRSDEYIARQFNVSEACVRNCRLGYSYVYTKGPLTNHKRQLRDADVVAMREEGANKVGVPELALRYDISPSYVSLVLRGLRRRTAGGPISEKRYKR